MARTPDEVAAGRRMLYWLAQAAKRARGNERREVVAALADQSKEIIKRFEDGENWPQKLDQLVAAYAEVGGLGDGRDLWQEALDLWWAHGTKPLTGRRDDAARRPSQRVSEQVAETAARQAHKRAERESARKTTSTPKRRATR